ncbi:MAG: nuclease A inhibitor family protein [Acidobacteriota bacterium]|nr:nuclease A inhibitor family protein [Acidobacteriota bacterium]
MNNIGNRLAAIQELAGELNFISESDNEVNAYIAGRNIITLTPESFKAANPQLQYEAVVSQSFDDVMQTQENLRQGWALLRCYLENNLSDLIVFKTGTIRREVFIVGLFDNHIIGVRSFAIET